MKKFTVLMLCFFVGTNIQAQKKKIYFSQLDINHGLYFQPNTMEPYSGLAYEDFSNGKKKMHIPIEKGKIHGKVREWAKNSEKVFEAEYINGVQQGIEMQWYASGRKKLEVNYLDGVADGTCTEWYENEVKKSVGFFKQGKEEGEHNWWYSNGAKDQTVNYKNGLAEGVVKNWYQNGQLKLKSQFKNGKKDGTTTEWYAVGQKMSEEFFVEGKEQGEARLWSRNGKLLALKIYEDGKLIKDYNYRSGNIRIPGGFLQVFNEKNSFVSVRIIGEDVYPKKSTDIIYIVDNQVLQLFNTPIELFYKAGFSDISKKELLEQFVTYESAYIQSNTNSEIEVKHDFGKTKSGKEFVYWSFTSPSSQVEEITPTTVLEEHYISLICNDQVINLYSLVTPSNNAKDVQQMLKRIVENVIEEKERIDLNALALKVTSDKN